jgi:DNA-binding PadR family transcriptional regulator
MFNHRHHSRGREAHSPRDFGLHGHFGRHRARRAERIFDQGDLRYVVLRLVAEQPRHGYEIIKAIEEKVGGAYSPSPGVIYPTLTLLEELGYVTIELEAGGKKRYRITPEGEAALADQKPAVDAIFRRMEDVHARFDGPSPRIARAMMNLGGAIRTRMSSGSVSPEQLDAIVSAIDAAAKGVEKA